MSERDIGKAHVLPSFSPEWEHPTTLISWAKFQPEVVAMTVGNFWQREPMAGNSQATFSLTRREFIGFRLVRAT